jgi:hypothetical protein
MRPSAIRVFDGLRVTTEHVEHLQAALDTAVRDLREIVGIGQVHRGFEVRATGPASIEVGPGLAFDLLGNRLVADERQTLDATFTEGAPDPLVCIRHEQVEMGEVEGVQTLVFDSASAFLADAEPGPGDLSIVVARLVRTEAGGDPPAFDVVDMRWPEEPSTPAEEPAAEAAEPAEEAAEPADEATQTAGGAPAPASGVPLRAARGLVRLGQPPEGGQTLADLTREGRITLGEAPVPLPFQAALLSADVQLSMKIDLPSRDERPASTLDLAATARGEAAFDVDRVDQHGLTNVDLAYAAGGGPATGWSASLLAEGQLAGFDLEPLLADAADLDLGPVGDAIAGLELSLEAARTLDSVVLRCWLGWKGAVDGELLERLTAAAPTLGWTAQVAWRGVGTVPPSADVQPAGGA